MNCAISSWNLSNHCIKLHYSWKSLANHLTSHQNSMKIIGKLPHSLFIGKHASILYLCLHSVKFTVPLLFVMHMAYPSEAAVLLFEIDGLDLYIFWLDFGQYRSWLWPWIFKIQYPICYIPGKNGPIATKWKTSISIEVNTKITLECAHKQFVMRVHTLFCFLHDIRNLKWH